MRLLLDTHYLIWLAAQSDNLTQRERAMIDHAANDVFLSVVSLWEVRTKWHSFSPDGSRKGLLSPAEAQSFIADSSVSLVQITPADCIVELDPRPPHRDPFDEMLLVHAQRLGARLLTRDRHLRSHPLALQL